MYIYANSQIIAQHNGDHIASRYFYLHDRLGSVRQLIDNSGTMDVVNRYTYDPFGELFDDETEETTISNPFKFTSQYFDDEIEEYYLRARQYNPHIGRFTSRDPVEGTSTEPMTLHLYLFCNNDPTNRVDPTGLWTIHIMGAAMVSAGPSFMAQAGVVIDDKGNVGWIVTHNLQGIAHIKAQEVPSKLEDWGGLGSPAAFAGIAFGFTNADTIFDLEGAGVSIGGSLGKVLSGTVDYLGGEQRSGQLYHGVEVTLGFGVTPWFVEGHILAP